MRLEAAETWPQPRDTVALSMLSYRAEQELLDCEGDLGAVLMLTEREGRIS